MWHDHWQMFRVGLNAKNPTHLDAAEHRKVQVQQDQVGRTVGERSQGRIAADRDIGLELTFSLECSFDQGGDIVLVLDDQDAVRGHSPPQYAA
jgi:hypothetical protein